MAVFFDKLNDWLQRREGQRRGREEGGRERGERGLLHQRREGEKLVTVFFNDWLVLQRRGGEDWTAECN